MSLARPPGFATACKRNRARATLLATILAVFAGGCGPEPEPPAPLPEAPPPRAGELVVRLAFSAAADLDLYVTGPDLEIVYFANTPSKLGGELERDLRCDAESELRVEVVRFPNAATGRYRVGVDFPERCELPAQPIPYTVEVRSAEAEQHLRGLAALGEFEPLVLEFEHPAATARSR